MTVFVLIFKRVLTMLDEFKKKVICLSGFSKYSINSNRFIGVVISYLCVCMNITIS